MQISRWRPLWHEHPCQDLKGDSIGAYFLVTPNSTIWSLQIIAGDSTRHQSRLKNFPEQKLSGAKKKNRKETTPESKLTIAGVLARKLVGLVWMLNFFPVWEGALSCFYSRSFFLGGFTLSVFGCWDHETRHFWEDHFYNLRTTGKCAIKPAIRLPYKNGTFLSFPCRLPVFWC